MQTRTVVTLPVILAIAVFQCAIPLPAAPLEASPSQQTTREFYAPSLTPAIYLINFLFLYIANPDVAASLPAYKAPIPQPVVDCLEQNPAGCPYAAFRQYFEEQAALAGGNAGDGAVDCRTIGDGHARLCEQPVVSVAQRNADVNAQE